MFEITTANQDLFENFQKKGKAYRDGVYDFTFDNAFIVYHANLTHENTYIALNVKDGTSVRVLATKDKILKPEEYRKLVPHILDAIKYTGDMKYLLDYAETNEEMIDFIFREILPKYGYRVREEQIKLSKEIYKGLVHNKISICEAEVGTGKTLAYLVAGVAARDSFHIYGKITNPPVTITTSSIELQNSLMNKEIPILSEALMTYKVIEKPLIAVLRKGKEHYLCPRRFIDFFNTISDYPEKYQRIINYFTTHKTLQRAFDLDVLPFSSSIKKRICVKGSCYKCKYQKVCKYNNYIRDSLDYRHYYDFQITNHNLFLTANKHNSILRESPYVIIDEAHKLSETARDIYGQEINETTIVKYLNMVKYHCKSDVKLSAYKELINRINAMNTVLFQSFKRAMRNNVELEKDFLINLSIAEKQTIQNLIDYIQTLESYKTALKGRVELQGERIIENLESLLKEDRVSIWLKMEEDETITVCSMDNHVGVNLERDLWKKTRGYALLSGTMSNGVDFDFFKKENGIDVVPSRKIKESYTKSPFDYSNNTRLYIPEDLPLPSNSCSEQYINAISDRIVELVKATNGHTAILFTSYKVLYLVYENTKDKLCEYDLFCMSRSNRNAISDFKKSNNGVLFASGSMWEGVDCQGDVLSSVIIVRLPFPLRSVSAELKKMEYDNDVKFINEYIVPTMLIKLRQGMGRLIRNENDTGLISILDTRARRRYTEDVKNVTSRFPQIESIDEIKEFFKEVKAESYFEN